MDIRGYPKSLIDTSKYLILVEFSGIVRLVNLSRFSKFRFRVRVVYCRVFLFAMGGGK